MLTGTVADGQDSGRNVVSDPNISLLGMDAGQNGEESSVKPGGRGWLK